MPSVEQVRPAGDTEARADPAGPGLLAHIAFSMSHHSAQSPTVPSGLTGRAHTRRWKDRQWMRPGMVSGSRRDGRKPGSTELGCLCRSPSALDERMNRHIDEQAPGVGKLSMQGPPGGGGKGRLVELTCTLVCPTR